MPSDAVTDHRVQIARAGRLPIPLDDDKSSAIGAQLPSTTAPVNTIETCGINAGAGTTAIRTVTKSDVPSDDLNTFCSRDTWVPVVTDGLLPSATWNCEAVIQLHNAPAPTEERDGPFRSWSHGGFTIDRPDCTPCADQSYKDNSVHFTKNLIGVFVELKNESKK